MIIRLSLFDVWHRRLLGDRIPVERLATVMHDATAWRQVRLD